MKIAIHHREESFSERWIEYCKINKLDFVLVDCYKSDIMNILGTEKATHLMWHFHHSSSKDMMVFPYVLNAADKMGIKTFPDFDTRWHFDDKVAQKYILESIGAPVANNHAFYDEQTATEFIRNQKLPIVAKLKRGAGSTNVKLIHSKSEGLKYIKDLFTKGAFANARSFENFAQKKRAAKKIKDPIELLKRTINFIQKNRRERRLANLERGYVYFQDFMPNNDFDTRIVVIGDKAFGIRRLNKENDFKASGSGKIDYDVNKIDLEMVRIAFEVTDKLSAQCLAYDFVTGVDSKPKIIEISFGYAMRAYDACEGYWTRDLSFKPGPFNPQAFMMADFIDLKES